MIAGMVPCSFNDYPGQLAAVVFTQGCNLRCCYCHNPDLCSIRGENRIEQDALFRFLKKRIGRLGAVVVSGGEPTLHKELPDFLRQIGEMGFLVKLDTNGMFPQSVFRMVEGELVDYVAVDVKVAPGTSSLSLCGSEHQAEKVLESLSIVTAAGVSCEARTTVLQGIHDVNNLCRIATALADVGVRRWFLQPVQSGAVLDPAIPMEPPQPEILEEVIGFAGLLGVHAEVRTISG